MKLKPNSSRLTNGLLILVLAFIVPAFCSAQVDRAFTGSGDGTDWSDPANWSPSDVPDSTTENAIIDAGGAFEVEFPNNNNDLDVHNLYIGNDDTLNLRNNSKLTVNGPEIVNEFRINFLSLSAQTDLVLAAPTTTLSGAGEIVLSDAVFNNNRIIGSTGSEVLINGADHTIRGGGQLGVGTLGLINNGLIDANDGTMQIQPSFAGSATNNHIMQASGGGTLQIESEMIDNVNGLIIARNGSVVLVRDEGGFHGGQIESFGSGKFMIQHTQSASISGNITNDALVEYENGFGATTIIVANNTSLSGSGTLSLSSNNSRLVGENITDVLTNEPDHTIAGGGKVGDGDMDLINYGTIEANGSVPLKLQPNSEFINLGVMQASGGGILQFDAGRFDNTNGQIVAQNNSQVWFTTNAEIVGGELASFGTGIFLVRQFQSPIFSGEIFNGGSIEMENPSAIPTTLLVEDGTLLSGPGTIRLSNESNHVIQGITPTDILINDTEHTIAGTGCIGNDALAIINRGTILADQSAPLTIDTNEDVQLPNAADGFSINFINEGLIHVTGTGGLELSGQFENADGGEIQVDSVLYVNSSLLRSPVGPNSSKISGLGVVEAVTSGLGARFSPGTDEVQGTLTVNTDLANVNGLEIDIAGAQEHDQLALTTISGAQFGNNLSLVFREGFVPVLESFEIVTATRVFDPNDSSAPAIIGDFDNAPRTNDGSPSILTFPGGTCEVDYNDNSIWLNNFQFDSTSFDGDEMTILVGTNIDDVITLTAVGGSRTEFILEVNGNTQSITAPNVINKVIVNGGLGNDTITFNDVSNGCAYGGPGNDVITNNGVTRSFLFGEDGDDIINGGRGQDYIEGGLGYDEIFGGNGIDIIHCGDLVDFDFGPNLVFGGPGADEIFGSFGDDMLNGGDGFDYVEGGDGNDTILGGLAQDMLFGDSGDDIINGGEGNDTIYGGLGDDEIFGSSGRDAIFGETGEDFINGGVGNDTIDGGSQDDTVIGGDGADIIYGRNGNDILNGNRLGDTIYGGTGDDTINGGDGADQIFGQAGNDVLRGNNHSDVIDGGPGDDTLTGGQGNDELHGGGGIDTATDTGEAGESGIEN